MAGFLAGSAATILTGGNPIAGLAAASAAAGLTRGAIARELEHKSTGQVVNKAVMAAAIEVVVEGGPLAEEAVAPELRAMARASSREARLKAAEAASAAVLKTAVMLAK